MMKKILFYLMGGIVVFVVSFYFFHLIKNRSVGRYQIQQVYYYSTYYYKSGESKEVKQDMLIKLDTCTGKTWFFGSSTTEGMPAMGAFSWVEIE